MEFKEENQTKKWIIEAFFELLKTKDYHDITITHIVDKAGLGRRTFYRHFDSKICFCSQIGWLMESDSTLE